MSYGPTAAEGFRTVTVFVDKVLKGADASAIPIEQAKTITLSLNKRAADAIGLEVPRSILIRADKIIE